MKKILHGNHARINPEEDMTPLYQSMVITNYVHSKRTHDQALYLRDEDVKMAKEDIDARHL